MHDGGSGLRFYIDASAESNQGRRRAFCGQPRIHSLQADSEDRSKSFLDIDCEYSLEPPRRGGSNEYPHSMFLSRNKKNNVYPSKPQFYYIKVGFKWVSIIYACFRDERALAVFDFQIKI